MKPCFLNLPGGTFQKVGYLPYLRWLKKPEYDFSLDPRDPLMFRRSSGELVMPDRHFRTDFGSIPRIGQLVVPKDQYLEGFLEHDSLFLHHGGWFKRPDELCFSFRRVTMQEANQLLYEMMLALGAWKITAAAVRGTLNLLGGFAWSNQHRRARAGSQMPVEEDAPALGIGGAL